MHKYDDIIRLPHHVSTVHPQMSVYDRAAQFSPFAALTGHEAAIRETARLTEQEMELEEDKKEELDERLQELVIYMREHPSEHPAVSVTYFKPDEKKTGGEYVTASGRLKRIDRYEKEILFTDGRRVEIEKIAELEICNA